MVNIVKIKKMDCYLVLYKIAIPFYIIITVILELLIINCVNNMKEGIV